jgi:hypothetical protein
LTDHHTTASRRHRQVLTLLAVTPVGGILSLGVTFVGYLANQIDSEATFFIYCVAVLLCAVPALWLVIATIRLGRVTLQRRGLKVSAVVVAGVFLAVGGLVTGPLIADPIGDALDLAIDRSAPPTEAELAYTPSELEQTVEQTITEALAGIPQTHDEPFIHESSCLLSNRTDGSYYSGRVLVNLDVDSSARWEEAKQPIVANWERMGFLAEPAGDGTNYLSTSGGPLERMSLREVGGHAEFDLLTVCVAGSEP